MSEKAKYMDRLNLCETSAEVVAVLAEMEGRNGLTKCRTYALRRIDELREREDVNTIEIAADLIPVALDRVEQLSAERDVEEAEVIRLLRELVSACRRSEVKCNLKPADLERIKKYVTGESPVWRESVVKELSQ